MSLKNKISKSSKGYALEFNLSAHGYNITATEDFRYFIKDGWEREGWDIVVKSNNLKGSQKIRLDENMTEDEVKNEMVKLCLAEHMPR